MEYDWKQLGAKIAKVGVAFLATGGVAALGGAAPLTILLAALAGEAIADGLGEIAEGVVSGIVPKEKGVLTRFQSSVQDCVTEQLKQSACPRKYIKKIQDDIMESLFGTPINAIVTATAEPQKAAACIKAAYANNAPNETMSDEDIIAFVDGLFSRLVVLIDNSHEFTTTVYLKNIANKVKTLQSAADETLRVVTSNDAKLKSLIENLARAELDNSQSASQSEFVEYVFTFEIDANGSVLGLSNTTNNAIREWFYDCAREDLSSVSDVCLADTFEIRIFDERVRQAQDELETIEEKLKTGESLDALGEKRYSICKKTVNSIRKENEIKSAALRFYLIDRFGYGIFSTFEYFQLIDIIIAILSLPCFDQFELDNNSDYVQIDVYLNFSGNNKKHEQFIAHIKRYDVVECFGGADIYDVYGHNVCDLGRHRRVIAPYFYQHLGKLQVIDKFDFTQDKRVLNMYSYYIGLH